MSFNKGDYVICIVKKFNYSYHSDKPYDIITKKGIISGTKVGTGTRIMHLVKYEHGDQRYFYEENIELDLVKIRDLKLKELGI